MGGNDALAIRSHKGALSIVAGVMARNQGGLIAIDFDEDRKPVLEMSLATSPSWRSCRSLPTSLGGLRRVACNRIAS